MSTEIAKKPLRQVSSVRELLVNDMAKQQLATVAAKHMRPERMMRIMANALRTTPQLAECEPLTLLGAMMTSASLGLEPNTPLAHAYLIPFKNRRKNITEIQFIIGWKGMIALARRSGAVVNIHADVVYEGDYFSYEYGSNQHLTHRPEGKRENPSYAYCHAKLIDGEAFIVLPWSVIEETRDNSQGYKTAIKYGKQDTPWIAHLHSMAKKTAVRRLFDELPISIEEVNDAIGVDEQRNDFRAFAFDPSSGTPSPEENGATIDGEYTEGDEVDEGDHDPETGEVKDDEKPAQKNGGDNAKDVTPKDEKPAEQKKANAPDLEQFVRLFDMIKTDLSDAGSVDQVIELYQDQIAQMAKDAPELHKDLQDEIAEYRKAEASEG